MKFKEFDVFVIGSGIAGQAVAKSCAKKGFAVAVADNREFGGTCANRGCDPKKVIFGITKTLQRSKNLLDKGFTTIPKASWKDLMKFKCEFTDAVPASTEKDLQAIDIHLYHQSPKFIDKNTLSVEGKTVKAKKIIIATGLIPRPLDIPGAGLAKTSDDFLTLEILPESMIFIGAGYIGMEFAHMAARFGVSVTVIEAGDRPLSQFDSDMVSYIIKASESIGIDFICNASVQSIEKLRKNTRVNYVQYGDEKSVKAELIFNTSGRIPSLQELDLNNGEVAFDKNGILVNQFLQNTTNENVYACGDVANNAVPLTPFSGREGSIVAHNLENHNDQKAVFPVTPTVTFTYPNIANVGLSEKEARKQYSEINVITRDASAFYNAKRIQEEIYAYKMIVDKRSGKILGASLVGPEAAEVINLLAMAIYNEMTVDQIKEMIFTYPSWSGDIQYMF